MKTPTRENCNAHALYHSIKIIIGKIINNMITAFRIMMKQKERH